MSTHTQRRKLLMVGHVLLDEYTEFVFPLNFSLQDSKVAKPSQYDLTPPDKCTVNINVHRDLHDHQTAIH